MGLQRLRLRRLQGLPRLQRLLWLQRLRLRYYRRLQRLRLHLLPVVGSLPPLVLDRSFSDSVDRRRRSGRSDGSDPMNSCFARIAVHVDTWAAMFVIGADRQRESRTASARG